MAAVSFAIAGAAWPGQYLRIVGSSAIAPHEELMPNLHGMFIGARHRVLLELLVSLVVVCLVWFIVRRNNFEYGMVAILVGGLLISYHAYLQDCVLLIPALLMLQRPSTESYLRGISIVLLAPFGYLYFMTHALFSWLIIMGFLLLLLGMCYATLRQSESR